MSGLLTGNAFTRTFPEMDTTEDGNGSASLQGTVYVGRFSLTFTPSSV